MYISSQKTITCSWQFQTLCKHLADKASAFYQEFVPGLDHNEGLHEEFYKNSRDLLCWPGLLLHHCCGQVIRQGVLGTCD